MKVGTVSHRERATTGTAFAAACCGIAIFSAMDATVKLLTLASGVYDALLWRSASSVVIAGAVHLGRRPRRPSAMALRLHVERGLVVTGMALMFFWGLSRVPMAYAIALAFVAPLLALPLAAIILHERIDRRAIAASVIAFAGVLVVVTGQTRAAPGSGALHGTLAVLGAACCYAYNLILMRRQGAHSDPVEVTFFQNLVTAATLAVAAPMLGDWPLPKQWPIVIGSAVSGSISTLLLAWAYARAPASRLAASEYTGFLWAALFGWAVFGERVAAVTVAGAVLIVCGCLVAARSGAAPPIEAEL